MLINSKEHLSVIKFSRRAMGTRQLRRDILMRPLIPAPYLPPSSLYIRPSECVKERNKYKQKTRRETPRDEAGGTKTKRENTKALMEKETQVYREGARTYST
jgi:hypothetical protein